MKSLGFSLIELLVVIAIVGVLSAIAVPVYNTYVIRSNISKMIAIMDPVKAEVIIKHNNGVLFTNALYKIYYDTNDTNKPAGVNFLYIGYYGAVDLRMDGSYFGLPADPWIMLIPKVSTNGIIVWTCAYHAAMDTSLVKYLPSSCQQIMSSQIGFSSSNGLSY